jgi:hypothetical protein
MKKHSQKLSQLQAQLKKVIDEVNSGKLDKKQAADKIIELREAMDQLIKAMQSKS